MNLESRVIAQFSEIDARDWERLDHAGNPFVSHAFLRALESSASVGEHSGWQPHHLALFQDGRLLACAPSYLKTHSHGEFVFDWAWADAYHRHKLPYYPKLLTAVPYSPVSGPRLLVREDHPEAETLRRGLVELACQQCEALDLSSWHCNFARPVELTALGESGMLPRTDQQFHWYNHDYRDFDDFLARLRSKKRKNIRRERRMVAEAGIRFEWKPGGALSPGDLDFVYRCYRATFDAYGNHAALTPEFFRTIAGEMGDGVQAMFALRGEQAVAMGLFLAGGGRLYGRYWGSTEDVPGLHFETAYYQGIEYCIEHGLEVFESGAQGEHKVSRGFVPTRTYSFHLIRNEAFRQAIAEFLARESEWQDSYRDQLNSHLPFSTTPAP